MTNIDFRSDFRMLVNGTLVAGDDTLAVRDPATGNAACPTSYSQCVAVVLRPTSTLNVRPEMRPHARAPANLADDPLEWIVGLHLAPVIARKREVRQRWLRPTQPPWLGASHAASPSLRAPRPRRSGALLGVDGLQHSSDVGDLALRHVS